MKKVLRVAAAASVVVLLAACGSGGGGSTSTSPQSSSSSTSGASAGSGDAAAAVEAAQALQPFTAPGDPLEIGDSVKGKTLYYIGNYNDLPFPAQIVDGLKQSTDLVGMKLVVVDMQGSSTTLTKLINQAVTQGAAAIIIGGTQSETASSAVQAAVGAGIPVFEALQQEPGALDAEASAIGIYGNVAGCYACQGKLLADYVASKSSDAVVAAIDSSDVKVAGTQLEGFKQELAKVCPGCTVKVSDVPASQWATGLATATNAILSDADVDFIFPAFIGEAVQILPAVKAAGAEDRVEIIGGNVNKAQLEDIKAGNVVGAAVGFHGALAGWAETDMAIRAINKLPAPTDANIGLRLFTSANVNSIDLESADQLAWFTQDDVAAAYSKLWGLTK